MGVYDQLKQLIQDLIAPTLQAIRDELGTFRGEVNAQLAGVRGELVALRTDLERLDQKIDNVDSRLTTRVAAIETTLGIVHDQLVSKIDSLRAEMISEFRRVDTRMDGMERELRIAIDIRERLAALEARRPA